VNPTRSQKTTVTSFRSLRAVSAICESVYGGYLSGSTA
jgi:hypothetical protein